MEVTLIERPANRQIDSFKTSARILAGAAAALFLLTAPLMASPFTKRPNTYTNNAGGGFSTPANAYDGSTITTAGASVGRHCHLDCTLATTAQTEWSGFEAGWAPTVLTVRWYASIVFTIYTAGYVGHAEAQVEYSLDDGGSWHDIDGSPFEYTEGTVGTTSHTRAMQDSTFILPRTQPTSKIRVRGTITGNMTQCGTNCNNVSGLTAAMQIADIRVDADCSVPMGETSTDLRWNTSLPGISAVDFQGNLIAANGTDFTGRLVREQSGGDGWDACSGMAAELISGGTWAVSSGNTYASDTIGVDDATIANWRAHSSLPCANTETQVMQISCLSSTDWVTYTSNSVNYTTAATTFSVTRANATRSR